MKAKANRLYKNAPEPLKGIIGVIIEYNYLYFIKNRKMHNTTGFKTIMKEGFTENQKKWIETLIRTIKGLKDNEYDIQDLDLIVPEDIRNIKNKNKEE